jgi:hypothetical protein
VLIGSLDSPKPPDGGCTRGARDKENEKELRGGIHAELALATLKDDDKTLVELAEPFGVHCG